MSTKLTKMASQNNHLKSFWHVFNNLLRGIATLLSSVSQPIFTCSKTAMETQ